MNFDNREIDDKKLLEEIDSLDSDYDVVDKKDSKNKEDVIESKNKKRNNIGIIILLVVVLIAYLCYEKIIKEDSLKYFYNKTTDKIETEQAKDLSIEPKKEDSYFEKIDTDEEDSLFEKIDVDKKDIERRKEFNEARKLVEIKICKNTEFGDIYAQLKNNSNYDFDDFSVFALFYDEEGEILDIEEEKIDYMEANSEMWAEFYAPDIQYAKCDFLLVKDYFDDKNNYLNLKENVSYTISEEENNIYINVKNNSDHEIYEVLFLIEYFDENEKLVNFSLESKHGIEAKESAIVKEYSDKSLLKNYKVTLISATGFNF